MSFWAWKPHMFGLARKKSCSKQSCCAFLLSLGLSLSLSVWQRSQPCWYSVLKVTIGIMCTHSLCTMYKYQVKSMCTVRRIVVGLHFIREWKSVRLFCSRSCFAFFTCVPEILIICVFYGQNRKYIHSHGEKMFNVFVLAHIASRH